MSRQKGSGAAIKSIDVAIRDMLWRNDSAPAENEAKLERLCDAGAELTVRLSKLRILEEDLRAGVNVEGVTLARAKSERQLRKVSADIRRVEKELSNTTKHIEETLNEVKKEAASDCQPAVLAWQERAVALIAYHKYLDPTGDHVASPCGLTKIITREGKRKLALRQQLAAEDFELVSSGSNITTRELQRQLAAEGFRVNERQLRRFVAKCGVVGQQGRRTDIKK